MPSAGRLKPAALRLNPNPQAYPVQVLLPDQRQKRWLLRRAATSGYCRNIRAAEVGTICVAA